MQFKNIVKNLLFVMIVGSVSSPYAEEQGGLDGALMDVGRDAAVGYMCPAVTVFGATMNSGWYNSSQRHRFLKLPFGFEIASVAEPLMNINEEMRTFEFSGKIPIAPMVHNWDQIKAQALLFNKSLPDELSFTACGVSTIFGSDNQKQITCKELFSSDTSAGNILFKSSGGAAPLLDSNETISLPFRGVLDLKGVKPSLPTVTAATIGFNSIPVIDNILFGFRFIPSIKINDDLGKIGQFGFKVQHEFTPHISPLKAVPFLHLSAFWAGNNLSIKGDSAQLAMNNWIGMINASVDTKILRFFGVGAFVGLGLEKSALQLDVPASNGLPHFSLSIPGQNKNRFQIGARISLACMDLWADANLVAGTQLYTAGCTLLSFNGI